MRKQDQIKMNDEVMARIEAVNAEIEEGVKDLGQLRSCSARVGETENYYILKSYRTIIAAIDKRDDTLVDFLRYVYGYTATSAQHINKFGKDYGRGTWAPANVLTFRYV